MGIPSGYTSAQVVQAVPIPKGIVQVQSTTKTDTFTMSSNTFTDVTGLSVSITPTSASNKVLVMVSMAVASSTTASMYTRLMRGSTAIAVGDAAGSRTPASVNIFTSGTSFQASQSILFLDSPATTSATTYKIQISTDSGTSTMSVNRTGGDTDSSTHSRTVSTITVMEVIV